MHSVEGGGGQEQMGSEGQESMGMAGDGTEAQEGGEPEARGVNGSLGRMQVLCGFRQFWCVLLLSIVILVSQVLRLLYE